MKSEWWVWDNPGKPFGNTIKNAAGQQVHLGIDTKHIRNKPEDYFKGALIWPEFGWVMSVPYPTRVEVVDLKQSGLGFAGWTGGGTGGVIMRNMRYYLEDKPHYLDDPDGEFWFKRKAKADGCTSACRMTPTRTLPASRPGSARTLSTARRSSTSRSRA